MSEPSVSIFAEIETQLAAIPDHAARARAAAALAQDVRRVASRIERDAVAALVDAHGGPDQYGSWAAAGRELGITGAGVRKRLGAETGGKPSAPEGEPGIYFADQHAAREALLDWSLRRKELDQQRDPLVRGALARLTPHEVRDETQLSLDVIDRLDRTATGVAVDVPWAVWEKTVAHLAGLGDSDEVRLAHIGRAAARGLAGALGMVVDRNGKVPPTPAHLQGPQWEALTPEEKAEAVKAAPLPDEGEEDIPEVDTHYLGWPDIWAADYCTSLETAARECEQDQEHHQQDLAAAMRRVAADIRHVRTTATLPAR